MAKSKTPRLCISKLAASLLLLASIPVVAQDASSKLSSLDDIRKDIDAVPCDDAQRLAAVRAMFERAGAPASEITLDKHGDVENLVVVKKGESPEKIVIGAHYDKVVDGCGAVDNWTGQVAMTNLYRTFRDFAFKKTLVFVAFGREEKGLVGSRAMVKAIPEEQVPEYCAMVNIDSLGLGPPQIADNMSGGKLNRLAAGLAKEMKIPFGHARLGGAYSDSNSFAARKIPAVTIHGLNSDWSNILHSPHDQASKVNTASVYLGYRLALAMVVRLDQSACAAYK